MSHPLHDVLCFDQAAMGLTIGETLSPCLSTVVGYSSVMLSAAKHLSRWAQMLHCAQHDTRGMQTDPSLREQNRNLRALKEELAKAGL